MKKKEILHILRNPYGYSKSELREAALSGADEIEKWEEAFYNIRDWAVENGVDVTTYN